MLVCAAGLNKDYPYTYVNGVLRDGDGDEIKLLDPRNGSSAARTSAIASPRIRTPVPRKRSSENVTPAFLKRNLRLGSTMSPIPRKRKRTDARLKRRMRDLSLGTAYRFGGRETGGWVGTHVYPENTLKINLFLPSVGEIFLVHIWYM